MSLKWNPCPCMSLQGGVKIIAGDDFALKLFVIIFLTNILVQLEPPKSVPSDDPDHEEAYVEAGIEGLKKWIIVGLVVVTIEILWSVVLYLGAVKKKVILCWVWIGTTVVSIVFSCLALSRESRMGTSLILSIFWISFRIYGLTVVIAFINEVRHEQQQGQNGNSPAVENQPQVEFQPENQDNSTAKPQPSVYAVDP